MLFINSCKDSQQILQENEAWLKQQFEELKQICTQLEGELSKNDSEFKHKEPLIIKDSGDYDVELVFESFWFKNKSKANTITIQTEFCKDYKWNFTNRKYLYNDSLIPDLMGTINSSITEKYRLSPYKMKESKFKLHLDVLKQVRYILFHQQLFYFEGKVLSSSEFKPAIFKGRLFLFDRKLKKFIGRKNIEVTNSDKIEYSSERYIEIYDKKHPTDDYGTYSQTIDLGSEEKRFKVSIGTDLFSRLENHVEKILKVKP